MSFFKRISPIPSFPAHTGPYKVGTVDVEIPANELQSSSVNSPPSDLPTVGFRVFYPCTQDSNQRGAKWIPNPQREYLSALAKFMGANNAFATAFSLLPQLLNHTTMPVHQDAEVLAPPTSSNRWPVMIFSHGLGGSRNAYSHICGSVAAHGIIVIAPDHHDGSGPLTVHHTPGEKQKMKRVEYRSIPHHSTPDVYEARDEQLRIRLWELGMIHDALLKMDKGSVMRNLAQEPSKRGGKDMLSQFVNLMDIHNPGSITFAGHSFGACTMVQFLKSVYYRIEAPVDGYRPLFTPFKDSEIVRQVTPANPLVLLDIWTLPIQSPGTEWLKSKPLPCYQSPVGGKSVISILSEAFYNWSSNYKEAMAAVAKPTGSQAKFPNQPGAHVFYPITSAHVSQSDFGVLFPWITSKVFGSKDPNRLLRLNTRAVLQVMRESGVEVANTSALDMEIEESAPGAQSIAQDTAILSKATDAVPGWANLGDDEGGQDPSVLDKVQVKIAVGAPLGSPNAEVSPEKSVI